MTANDVNEPKAEPAKSEDSPLMASGMACASATEQGAIASVRKTYDLTSLAVRESVAGGSLLIGIAHCQVT
jgi:hypothetical protein